VPIETFRNAERPDAQQQVQEAATQSQLIAALNPVIIGWSNYFRPASVVSTFTTWF
jgi:hypothetical protein